jgi:4-amino-4-deoxy-L-arabinose transferase-like glycosyltransferase
MSRRHTVVLLAILGLGATLRLWTIGDGLPYVPAVDEPVIFSRVADMMKTGDLHPHVFDYGGLIFYFHLAVAWVAFAVGRMAGAMPPLEQVAPSDLFLWGRVATALVGTAIIYVVFRAASRWGLAVAFLAAAAIAVQPMLVQSAHFALTDTPLVFFVALTLLLSLRAAESGTSAAFAWAGVAAGLATGVKYTGGLAGLMPLAAMFASVPPGRWPGTAAALFGGAASAYLVVAPYTLIDYRGFREGIEKLQTYYNRPMSFAFKADLYRKYMMDWFGLPGRLPRDYYAWPAAIVTLVGLGAIASGILARDGRARTAIMLVFPIAFFLFIANQSLSFGRYAMPMIPIIAIGLAAGMVRIYDVVARRLPVLAPIARVALLLLFLLPLLQAASFSRGREPKDTLELMGEWMDRTVQPGEPVVVEERWTPFSLPEHRFKARIVARLTEDPLEKYQGEGVVYLIWVNWEADDPFTNPQFAAHAPGYSALLKATELVQTFTPPAGVPGPTVRVLRVPR